MLLDPKPAQRREANLVPLINIVFLMLIFFLIAATLKPFEKKDIALAETVAQAAGKLRRDVVLISADGEILIDGFVAAEDRLLEALRPWAQRTSLDKPMMLVADRALDANKLIAVLEAANEAGIKHIKLITQHKRGS